MRPFLFACEGEMKIVQSGDPVGEVVSLELFRKQTRNADDTGIFNEDDDAILQQYLDAGIEWVQDACSTVLLTTEFTATGNNFALSFDGYPNAEISSIAYVDELGAPGVVTDYEIRDNRLFIENAPKATRTTIIFTAGIGAGNIPVKLKQAILMLGEHFYDKSGEAIPAAVLAMTAHHRSFAFGG